MKTIIKTTIALLAGAALLGLFRWTLAMGFLNATINTIFSKNQAATAITNTLLEHQKDQDYLRNNPDLLDMPPWEHENKWNKISNKTQTCWFHKKSLKKICQANG